MRTRSRFFAFAAVCLSACGGTKETTGGAEAPVARSEAEECIYAANVKRAAPKDPGPIGLNHILVRHRELKRAGGVSRSREQACLRAMEALEKLRAGDPWDEVVAEYSDERGAATRSGALGVVSADMLDSEFAAAAYELEPDQVSYVVETSRGFHIIHRLP